MGERYASFGEVPHRAADAEAFFVGRERERAVLAGALIAVAGGGGAHVLMLSGEPGIGKSRLMHYFDTWATESGAMVLRGGASQAEGMPPYLPFLEALGAYARRTDPERLRQQAGEGASIVAGIVPEVAARLGEIPTGYPLPPEQARLRLFEAVGSLLAKVADEEALVLLLDDLQWSDSSTLDMLCHITRAQPSARLLVVGAYREGEAPENGALQRALAELTRQRCLEHVRLGPLADQDVARLAEGYLQGEVEEPIREILYAASEGNPFFAEELLHGWLETDVVRQRGTRWIAHGVEQHSLPATILSAVQQRLARLDPVLVDVLRIAAIIGRTFDLSLLSAVTDREPETVEEYLLHATRARLVVPVDELTYSFSHDRIRECLYAELGATRRRRAHQSIGLAIEAAPDDGGRQRLADLAFHFSRSGDRGRGILYSQRAAENAARDSAIDEALAHRRTVLELLPATDERYGGALLDVAEAALLAGREAEAASAFERAQRAFLSAGDTLSAGRASHGLGLARSRQDLFTEARAALETALDLFAGYRGPERVRALTDLANLLSVSLSHHDEGMIWGRQALELADELGDSRVRAAANRTVGNLEVRANNIPGGIALLQTALALARRADDPAEAAECCACLANAYYWIADIERSREYTMMREELAKRCQQPYELRHVYTWLGFLAATQGGWIKAEQWLARARPLVETMSSAEPLAFFHQIRGFLAWEREDYALAIDELSTAVSIYREQGPQTLIWYIGPLGLAHLSSGNREEARKVMAELDSLLSGFPENSLPAAPALTCAVSLAAALADDECLDRYYPRLTAFSGQLHWFLIDPALAAAEAYRAERAAALAHLEGAEDTAQRAGMTPSLQRIREAKARLGQTAQSDGGSSASAGLSRREIEVLRLVAQGLSNRDIARRLYLSENTVAKHLTSIFNKTGTDNRTAAAGFAARHGLVE